VFLIGVTVLNGNLLNHFSLTYNEHVAGSVGTILEQLQTQPVGNILAVLRGERKYDENETMSLIERFAGRGYIPQELASHQNSTNNKEIQVLITELEDVQDILGSIHDSDTTIAYLKSQPNRVS
jgi:hypothetical protein